MASPDKDFFQLLRPGVILLRPPKKAAPGERISKYALVPYSSADFEQVGQAAMPFSFFRIHVCKRGQAGASHNPLSEQSSGCE